MTENKRFEICGEGSTNLDVTTYIVEYGDGDDDCFELYESKEDSQKVCDKLNSILDENEKLKKQKARYKRLSEIRNEEINNRILTIKEFIENCSDNKVKRILKELFYSEVNEYDLSSENRKLLNENKQLKQRINSRLHFYRELYESTNDKVVKRVIEDLEDILKE